MQQKNNRYHYLFKSIRFSFALGIVVSLFEASSFIFKTQKLIIGVIIYSVLSICIGFFIGATVSFYSKFIKNFEKIKYPPYIPISNFIFCLSLQILHN